MKENNPHILGEAPIGKLLVEYSIPAIIGMTLTSLYNIIDSIFIGHGVGALSISGLAITFPLMNLLVAFCTLVGVGGATLSSIRLGQKDKKGAEDILGNVAILCVINAIFYGGLAFIFLEPILFFFGASEATLPYARDFMQVILLGSPISYVMIGLNNIMRATGYPKKAMLSSMLTVGCNIILAPIFIFVLNWGIRGAALATICSQFIGMLWVLYHFYSPKTYIRFQRHSMRLKQHIIANIFAIGMSPFVMNVCACCIVIFINNRLLNYGGDMAIGAFGILNRIQMLFVMIVMGLNQGMQPIAGYNFGARQYHRVNQVLKLTIYGATLVTTSGFLVGELMPELAVSAFTTHEGLIERSATGLRIVVMFFPIIGFQMVTSNFFQSIGMASKAIFLSLTRQLLFLLPCIIILPMFWGSKGIWMSMPISDLAASIVAAVMLYRQFQIFKSHAQKQVSN